MAFTTYDAAARGTRQRYPLHGLDQRLLAATVESVVVTPAQESLVRRAANSYSEALRAIRDTLNGPAPSAADVVALAKAALNTPVDDSPELRGPHISVRMCQWMLRDRFSDLARIADADAAGADVLVEASSRVRRAFAPIVLR